MRRIQKLFCCLAVLCLSFSAFANADIEKIIIVRHGEKPSTDLGQLSCVGLNRSLMLPAYFHKNFAKPNYIFAPNPSVTNQNFSYVRPLATIEPTAIALEMPVNTQVGYNDPEKFAQTLLENKYHHATIIVAWEHNNIVKIANILFKKFDSNLTAPTWNENNYNMVFVFTIDWSKTPATLHFERASEGFKNISAICPDEKNHQ